MYCCVKSLYFISINNLRKIHINTTSYNNKNINHGQVKILRKLLGNRQSGSKKQWYANEINSTKSIFPSPQNFTKTLSKGKNVSRRVNILNKLFMKHVTDLMATGEISEEIVGKGLEISKVKVSSDFQYVNVYWIGKDDINDAVMDATLQKCAGHIRHELSQLRLMGEVPKIHFVKDKLYSNLGEVQVLLRKCDFRDIEQKNSSIEYFDNFNSSIDKNELNQCDNVIPAMRHDVFGLNHKEIMSKIFTKMKKSKKAWEMYDQSINIQEPNLVEKAQHLDKKEKELNEGQNKIVFKKYLLRRNIKNNPSRKNHFDYDQDIQLKEFLDNQH